MKCCLCGKKINGYGNNPWGALTIRNEPIKWKITDRCCDECNEEFVIPGRIFLHFNGYPMKRRFKK